MSTGISEFSVFQALTRELEWSAHLSLPAILLQLTSPKCHNLARAIYEHSLGLSNTQVSPQSHIATHSRPRQ